MRASLATLHSMFWLRDAVSWMLVWVWATISYSLKHKGEKYDSIAADARGLKKLPRHLALVVQEQQVSCSDLARMATWAFASDICLVSIYDPHSTQYYVDG